MTADLRSTIEDAFENRDAVNSETRGPVREAVVEALNLLDSGTARVAEKTTGGWVVNQWLKKAVLLGFRLNDMKPISGGPGGANCGTRRPASSPVGARRNSGKRLSGRSELYGSPFGPHRAGRGVDALFRQPGRLCGPRRHDRYLRPSGPARKSARTRIFPAGSGSAGCWSRCRPDR